MSIHAKEFLAIYFAFMEYSHILWGSTKPVIVLTDNKSVTRFFQTKIIPPALWNACDFVLQFNFTIAHVPGRMNTAADSTRPGSKRESPTTNKRRHSNYPNRSAHSVLQRSRRKTILLPPRRRHRNRGANLGEEAKSPQKDTEERHPTNARRRNKHNPP